MTGMARGDEGETAATEQVGDAESAPPNKAVYKVPEVTRRWSASDQDPAGGASWWPGDTPGPPQSPQSPQSPRPSQASPPPQQRPATPWQQPRPRPNPRSTWPRNLAYAVVAGVVAAGASSLPKIMDHHQNTASVPFGGQIPGLASGSSTTPKVYAHPDDRYFDGSPSFGWANGAEGIKVPQAVRIGSFPAQSVAAGYDGVRKLLIAADLDPTVLMGGDPKSYFDLVDPATGTRARYDAEAASPSRRTGTPLTWITRFDPKRTRLVGHTVKTQGTMTASTDANGMLHVVADFRFVYAVAPSDGGSGTTELSLVHRMIEIVAYPAGNLYQLTPGTYWLHSVDVDTANDSCTIDDGFLNPAFGAEMPGLRGAPVDPYSGTLPTQPITPVTSASPTAAPDDECHSTTKI